jgi:hypothetical protein
MTKRCGKLALWPFVLGALLCFLLAGSVEPMPPVGAQDFRSLQVWPDRSVGVASGLLGDATTHVAAQTLPLGAYRTSKDEAVHARTYLHFPLDVFPPGTEILRATLYMYVDGGSDTGEATFGIYRALESWEGSGDGWGNDPLSWPALLDLPLAATTARFDVLTPTLPTSITVATVTPGPAPELTLTPTATPATPTPTPLTSPLLTPTPEPTRTPTPEPTRIPTPTSALPAPVVPLGQVAETWLVWDVTALMRAWVAGEVPNDGLALASAPDPAADPEAMDNLLVARWLAAADLNTRPHIIAEFEVHPVTPTPTASPLPTLAPILPPAGSSMGWEAVGIMCVGLTLLALGLIVWHQRESR